MDNETVAMSSVAKLAIDQVQAELADAKANLEWLLENAQWINEVGIKPVFKGRMTFFFNPTHAQSIQIIQKVGGKFDKDYNATTVTYRQYGARDFILSDSQPPGTCRLVPTETVVEAHWEPEKIVKGFRLECKPAAEELTTPTEGKIADSKDDATESLPISPVTSENGNPFIHAEEA